MDDVHSAVGLDAPETLLSRVSDAAQAEPRLIEGILLVMACWTTVLAPGLLAPVLPQLGVQFGHLQNGEMLVGLVMAAPALVVALLAFPVGWLCDRMGHRNVLFGALLFFGTAGVVPFWLEDIGSIIAARAVVGLGEAGAMIAATALVGLRFSEAKRGPWLGAQIGTSNVLGVLALLAGGFLGRLDWHMPFLAYGFGILLLIPSLFFVKVPARANRQAASTGPLSPALRRMTIKASLFLCGIEIAAISGMFAIVFQLAFLFDQRGAADPAEVGMGIACGAAGLALGTTVSGAMAKINWRLRTSGGFMLGGLGFVGVSVVTGYWETGAMAFVAGVGVGTTVPALLTALVAAVPASVLGAVVGVWTAATFIGQFGNFPLFMLLKHITGSQSGAVGLLGICLVVLGLSLTWLGKFVDVQGRSMKEMAG